MKSCKLLIRVLSALLLTAFLLPLLVGCKTPDTPEPPSDDPGNTPDDPPVQEEELLQFIQNGVVTHTVVRPEAAENDLKKAAVRVCSAIKEKTGVKTVSISDDYVPRGESAPTDTAEILVGLTNREESIAAHAQLAENEYVIAILNNRLVIVGYDDNATIAAVDYFVTNILEACGKEGSLALEADLALKNTYTPQSPDGPKPPIHSDPETYPEQNKPTVSPAEYIKPSYTIKDGMYVQQYRGFELEGVRTTFQASRIYADIYNIHTDSVMVYSSADDNFKSWYHAGDYVIDMMIAINRAGKDYLNLDKDNYDDIQMDASGNYIVHTADTQWYMVPSESWIEFAWSNLLEPVIEKYHPQSIALEEPEMWIRSGYSEAFKREWEDYYGEEWQAPNSSAEANLKANLLKTYLFERILIELSSRVKELSPGTQVYIASHSTVNYTAWSITAGLNTYLATGAIDGVIGQTWADTHNSAFAYNGTNVRDNFTNAYIEYCSYVDSVEGTNFYALADPMADGKNYKEADLQYIYRQSIAAQLMQPEINRFQVLPWVSRAYANVSPDYRTVQAQIFEMLNDIGGQKINMSAGTPGIAYLASDSLSWMNSGNGWALSTANGMYGICAPLVRAGVPVKMKAMEQIYTAKDLEGVNLLIVSFDTSVPLSEEVNIAIADWVKAGGTMLYVGGHNQYWNIDDHFFWAKDKTPLDNLFKHLGLDIKINTSPASVTAPLSSNDLALKNSIGGLRLPATYSNYTVSFEGAEYPILSSGNTVLGFDQQVGSGYVVVVGIPSAALSGFEGGSSLMRALTDYTCSYLEDGYLVTSPIMVTERGNYTIAHAFESGKSLKGSYIDLFDSNLTILDNPTIPKDDSLILYNIANIDRSIPRLGYTSGQVLELDEKTDSTVIRLTSAANTNLSVRLLAPNNCYPASLEITDENGKTYPVLGYFWDAKHNSCLIKMDGNKNSVTLKVTWGKKQIDLGVSSKVFVEEIYKTNQNDNEDVDFIEPESTASANHGVRFCDGALQLIYKFDLFEYDTPLFRFNISQNYILEISSDKKQWTIIADYSQGGTRDRVVNGANAETFSIDPSDYGLDDVMYVRLRNTDTVSGFGGAISSFSIRHLIDAEDSTTTNAPANRLEGINNTSDIKDSIKISEADEESKYIVSTNQATGIATYRRNVKTNSHGEDASFIYFNTAGASETVRFCDGDRQLIYLFDVSTMLTAEFEFNLFQNYILEVSTDGKKWAMVADYSKGGTVPHITTGQNKTNIRINPFDYGCEETGTCYVRLRNSDTSKGWGGSIIQFTLDYTRKIK